jgi:hypothetical protein
MGSCPSSITAAEAPTRAAVEFTRLDTNGRDFYWMRYGTADR